MTTQRRLAARFALALGITGSVISFSMGPATAAVSSITVNPGTTITANGTVTVSASSAKVGVIATGSRTLTLAITAPGDSQPTYSWPSKSVPNTQDGSISGSFSTTAPPWSTGGQAAANGQYTITATDGSSGSKNIAVTLAVPPSDVSGFTGSASGSLATFTWTPNADNVPDFAGYQISDGANSVTVSPTSGACGASTCSVSVDYGSAARGQTYSFSIVALRSKAPGSSGTVPSADPATTNVAFPAPPSPAPSSTDGSGGSGSGSTATGGGTTTSTDGTYGGTSGGATTGSDGSSTSAGGARGPVLTGKNPSADLGRYLPTVSAGAAPNLPSVVTEIKPIPQGTYKPTLAYPDQTSTSASTKRVPSTGINAVGHDIVKVLNLRTLWTSLAAAALLLLVAGHLRTWLESTDLTD